MEDVEYTDDAKPDFKVSKLQGLWPAPASSVWWPFKPDGSLKLRLSVLSINLDLVIDIDHHSTAGRDGDHCHARRVYFCHFVLEWIW